jgi:hypothetical protein
MKKIIRMSAFETNSSSANSFSIGKNIGRIFVLDALYPNDEGILHITNNGENFGNEYAFKNINDAEIKAAYLLWSANKFAPEQVDLILETIKEVTGAEQIVTDLGEHYVILMDPEFKEIVSSKESIKEFVFSKNSWLFFGRRSDREIPFFDAQGKKMKNKKGNKKTVSIEGFDKTTVINEFFTERDLDGAFWNILRANRAGIEGEFILENFNFAEKTIILFDAKKYRGSIETLTKQRFNGKTEEYLTDEEYLEFLDENITVDINDETFYKKIKFTIT